MPAGESEARAKTRERFQEVIKKYTDPPSEEKKRKKKKKSASSEPQESIVLQTLKNSLNLEKDTEEDETVLQNTYRPEQASPRFTKNKRRERETIEKINLSASGSQDETYLAKGKRRRKRELPLLRVQEDIQSYSLYHDTDHSISRSDIPLESYDTSRKVSKKKSKKGKEDLEDRTESQVLDAEDELLREYQQQIAQDEESTVNKTALKTDKNTASSEVLLNNDIGKKKKKKLKSVNPESDIRDQDADDAEKSVDSDMKAEAKEKKKKNKRKVVRGDSEAEVPQNPRSDESLVLGVYIHRTDRLKTDLMMSHPMVKIHIVDENTGQYLKKEHSHRPVSSFYEQENVDHILPIITQPFDFKKRKSTIPEWEELIIFNERFGYFLQQGDAGPKVMLFFEVLDFMTMEEARASVDVDGHERGFRKIAWAFLKLVGTNGVLNIDSKLRLQLFCAPVRAKAQPKAIEVVDWWRKFPRNRYASTLYITVKGIRLPEHVDPSVRSMMALQEERGSTSYSELHSEVTRSSLSQHLENKASMLRWSRLPGQVCRIPNKAMLSFRGGQMGCFTVRFSHSGTILAAACADRDAFPVIVYEIPSGKVLAAFNGHLSVVYDLCWSRDDQSLLSASSDGTVRAWDVEKLLAVAHKVLPHPSFVYCAQYHPTAPHLVVTGGYDCAVRVWRLDVSDVNGQLLQEFEGHDGFVNSACFDSEGKRMFTADNSGQIIVWTTLVNDRKQRQPVHGWCIERKIAERDLNGVPINMLELHPNGRRLLIHAKNSVLRVMDLRILTVSKYIGSTNYRERIYSTFSPCGSFLFSGSEDGMAYVWNAETGDQVAVYSELCYTAALRGVAFHPHENMVAFCAFGQSQPIHVYLYDHKVSQMEVQKMKGSSRAASSRDTTMSHPLDSLALRDTSAALDQYAQAARLALRMHRVRQKLDSVLEQHGSLSTPGYTYEQDNVTHMGRSHTLDIGKMGLNASSLPPPSLLSPHSKLQLSGALAQQLIPQAALSTHNRGFSPVGLRLKGATSRLLQTSLPDYVSSANHTEAESDSLYPTVVSLYDYSANRSDELNIHRGDVIRVLYKDNDTWWFGRLADGQQGYFPANYVAEEKASLSMETGHTSLSEGTVERSTPTKVSAAISSTGELKFLSEQDTDPEITDSKACRKKKVTKPGAVSPPAMSSAPAASGSFSTRRPRSQNRPLPKRPIGHTNDSFEHDTMT